MKISSKKYIYSDDLKRCLSEYDAFICGSDQVWNPNSPRDRKRALYLTFAKQSQVKKISYAASFGVSIVSESCQEEIRPWINDIDSLSVREETGRAIIEQITGRQSEVVLDPTLLLESKHWDNLASPSIIKHPYILVYSTSQRGLFSELVKHIKELTHLPVVVLSLNALNLIPKADRVIYDAGPCEFISLFANATCVCTNSFHGTTFSIIYRKPFWSVPHPQANSRIADLLNRIGLANRQVITSRQFPKTPLEIDYEKPSSLLDREQTKSLEFLKTALK